MPQRKVYLISLTNCEGERTYTRRIHPAKSRWTRKQTTTIRMARTLRLRQTYSIVDISRGIDHFGNRKCLAKHLSNGLPLPIEMSANATKFEHGSYSFSRTASWTCFDCLHEQFRIYTCISRSFFCRDIRTLSGKPIDVPLTCSLHILYGDLECLEI